MHSHLSVRAKLLFMFFDFAVLVLCGLSVCAWRTNMPPDFILKAPSLWFISTVQLVFLYLLGLYDFDRVRGLREQVSLHAVALAAGLGLTIFANYFLQKDRSGLFGRGVLTGFLALFYVLSLVYRGIAQGFFSKLQEKAEILFLAPPKLLQFLNEDLKRSAFSGNRKFLTLEDLDENLFKKNWSSVVVGLKSEELSADKGNILMDARFSGHRVIDLNTFYERVWRKLPIYYLGTEWFILSEGFSLLANPIGLRFKRLIDLGLSTLLLILTWPFMLITALAVRLESPGPVIYSQTRTGHADGDFTIYKFRSMRTDAEKDGAKWAEKADARITIVGKFIRITRLDELPQLWNVFRGDMSFIGPRPERPEFNQLLEKEIPFYKLRHLVRPGITGWAQVMYPYGASIDDAREKLKYDLFYIKNYSLLLDLQILFKTVKVILFGRGR